MFDVVINHISTGSGYTGAPTVKIASPPFMPNLTVEVMRVRVTQRVMLGRKYVLESSTNLNRWAPAGQQFTAWSETIENEFDVDATGRYFRIREVP
jgi:hypothetical protein